jgi:hypothetical protein
MPRRGKTILLQRVLVPGKTCPRLLILDGGEMRDLFYTLAMTDGMMQQAADDHHRLHEE